MSHEDSLDDEVKAILAKADTDDSSESNIPKFKKNKQGYEVDDDGFESNTMETPDSEW